MSLQPINTTPFARDLTGVTRSFKGANTYGFVMLDKPVTLPDGGTSSDAFVHFTQIQMDGYKLLTPGQRVVLDAGTCNAGDGKLAIFAVNVRPVSAEQAVAGAQQVA